MNLLDKIAKNLAIELLKSKEQEYRQTYNSDDSGGTVEVIVIRKQNQKFDRSWRQDAAPLSMIGSTACPTCGK